MKKRLRFARPRRGLRVPSPRRSRRPAGRARGPPNAIATAARDSPGACGRNDPLKFPFSSCLPHDAQVQAGNCVYEPHSRASRCGRDDAKCGELRSNATNAGAFAALVRHSGVFLSGFRKRPTPDVPLWFWSTSRLPPTCAGMMALWFALPPRFGNPLFFLIESPRPRCLIHPRGSKASCFFFYYLRAPNAPT